MNRSIFVTRFKELYKEKGYTQEELAETLNVSKDTIKSYTKKDGVFPPIDTLYKLSEILDADISYFLVEEQTCKHIKEQMLSSASGLDSESASIISNLNNSEKEILNKLIKSKNFKKLITESNYFTRYEIDDALSLRFNDITIPSYQIDEKTIQHNNVLEIFSDILKEVYADSNKNAPIIYESYFSDTIKKNLKNIYRILSNDTYLPDEKDLENDFMELINSIKDIYELYAYYREKDLLSLCSFSDVLYRFLNNI